MLTLPTLTRGNVETVGVQWGRTDKQAVSHRLPTDSPPWVWGGYCLWRGRGWEGPDTLGCRIRSTLGVGGLGEPADPTRQNPKKASILASEPPDVLEEESGPAGRRESCPGTPSRGPEKRGGGGGAWLSPSQEWPWPPKGQSRWGRRKCTAIEIPRARALLLGCQRVGRMWDWSDSGPGGKEGRRWELRAVLASRAPGKWGRDGTALTGRTMGSQAGGQGRDSSGAQHSRKN